MTRSLKRARVEQKTKALQLLTLSGAIRPANVEARYRGSDMRFGVTDRQRAEVARQQDSIWWMDLTAVLKAFQARQSGDQARRTILIDQRRSAHRTGLKRPAAPGTA